MLPIAGPEPNALIVSRFIAKIALEAMAKRVIGHDGGQDFICDEKQFDELRDHARRGRIIFWPVHTRRIYAANAKTESPSGNPVQMIHESDFLATSWGEWFFVLAIFGLEFTINIGGPDIEGYKRWLRENNEASPLYFTDKPSFHSKPTLARDE